MKQRLRSGILLLAAFFLLGNVVACFDEPEEAAEQPIQAFSLTVDITSETVGAIVGETFHFGSGAGVHPNLAGIPTDVTFTSSSSMEIDAAGGTASGSVVYGSCDVTLNNNTVTPIGQTVALHIEPCQYTITTLGSLSPGETGTAEITTAFGGQASNTFTATVTITPGGVILVNGQPVGRIENGNPTTGGQGGGG